MREWVTHLGGRARGGGFAEITREGGASGEFDGLRRRGNDGYIFSRQSSRSRAEIVSRGGRERTPIDGRSSIAIHRSR